MASLVEILAGLLNGTAQVPADVVAAVASSAPTPAYDPMSGALIGSDTGRTASETAPNRYARAAIQSIGGLPFSMAKEAVTLPQRLVDASKADVAHYERSGFGGGDYVPQAVAPATETAMNLAGIGTPFAVSGAAGVFGGRLAKTADHAKLARAEEMAAAGAGRKAIWDETGWFKGGDDKWRFEIPDHKATVPASWHETGIPAYRELPLSDALRHDPLYAAYPDLRRVNSITEQGRIPSGAYNEPVAGIGGGEAVLIGSPNAGAARSTALHEVQHAIQVREGFARGGSPMEFSGDKSQRADAYQRLAGEVEARNVQKRRDMTPEELRARPPWKTMDVSESDQLFGGGRVGMLEGGAQMSAPAKPYPVAPRGEWYGDANFDKTGGRMVTMTPDEFLAKARPMKIDDVARENIDDLKKHMQSGKTLDPLAIYKNGKEDGRHRAIAAKELGINEVPVLVWDK